MEKQRKVNNKTVELQELWTPPPVKHNNNDKWSQRLRHMSHTDSRIATRTIHGLQPTAPPLLLPLSPLPPAASADEGSLSVMIAPLAVVASQGCDAPPNIEQHKLAHRSRSVWWPCATAILQRQHAF